MHFVEIFLPRWLRRWFLHTVDDPAIPLARRFQEHRVRHMTVAVLGDSLQLKHFSASAGTWTEDQGGQPGSTGVALVTSKSLAIDVRDLQALPGGNTEHSVSKAIAERSQSFLRDLFESERAYYAVPTEGRRAIVFHVKKDDVTRAITELQRAHSPVARAVCGLGAATKLALADQAARYPGATAVVVNDQGYVLTIPLRLGKVELGATLQPQLFSIKLDGKSEAKPESVPTLNEIRNLLKRAARQDESSSKGMVILYTTATGTLRSKDAIAGPDYAVETATFSTSDLCFA